MIYVLAKDHKAAVEWCRANRISPRSVDTVIVTDADPSGLAGRRMKPEDIVRVNGHRGTDQLEDLVRAATMRVR